MSLKRLSHISVYGAQELKRPPPSAVAVVSVLEHHKRLCDNLFKDIVTDPSHKLPTNNYPGVHHQDTNVYMHLYTLNIYNYTKYSQFSVYKCMHTFVT